MRRQVLLGFLVFLVPGSVSAETLSLTLTNFSGEQLESMVATPKDATELSDQNSLSTPIAHGETGDSAVETSEGNCVFDLRFVFSSGRVVERPDTDICQTDGIIVE